MWWRVEEWWDEQGSTVYLGLRKKEGWRMEFYKMSMYYLCVMYLAIKVF